MLSWKDIDMKISKFPLFSLVLLVGSAIYAVAFCKFDTAKILLDDTCKTFVRETMTTFLSDLEQAKNFKGKEISDEALEQFQNMFKSNLGQCKLKDISTLKGFRINSSIVLKIYDVTLDCEKKKDMPITVILRQKGNTVEYVGLTVK